MGDVLGPEAINESCGKMTHRGNDG
jgi:hypothetical protein